MTNLNEITYVDWQYKLNKIGESAEGIDDINQCIATILTTRKGSVPHRPTFGSDIYKYIDYPINEAIPHIVRETTDAITLWESRVKVVAVSVEINITTLVIEVEWQLTDSQIKNITTVKIQK